MQSQEGEAEREGWREGGKPSSHPLTAFIVREAYECVLHDGIKETLTEVRRKFWIPRVRSLTRQIIHWCVLCQKLEGIPFIPPPPPPLSTFRVKDDPAFTYTAVISLGLFMSMVSMMSLWKAWICLFTYYVTRAVSLEATPDQSTKHSYNV